MLQSHSAHNLLTVPCSSDPSLNVAEKKRNGKPAARPSSPLLRAKNAFRRTFSTGGENVLQREREAKDAVSWLKAAGFPQYVQMYADGEFPIDLSKIQVETDHKFLDKAAIESLLRRLRVLNHCADLFVDRITKYSKEEESDEEDLRALSSHWKFQKRSKRWSRHNESTEEEDGKKHEQHLSCQAELSRSLSNLRSVKDFLFAENEDDPPLLKTQSVNCIPSHSTHSKSEGYFSGNDEPEQPPITSGSQPDLAAVITAEEASNPAVSLPVVPSSRNYHTLPAKLPLVNIERPRHFSSPPMLRLPDKLPDECDSPSILSPVAVFFSGEEFVSSTESILEALANEVSSKVASIRRKATNLVSGTVFQQQAANSSAYGSSSLSDSYEDQEFILPKPTRDKYSTSSEHNVYLPAIEMAEESSGVIHRRNENARRARHVWHSFQKGHSFRQALKPVRMLIPIDELSVGQMTVLRKLSLVRLTSLLEMHNASSKILSRLSWSRQPRMVQYKDKKVFGVPLLLNVSQTGCALPQAILDAMRHLRKNGLASKGIFRKTAYRSRVSTLKELIETNPDHVNYSDFTVYEVADLLKLYFRDLPEVLLTDKLSEVLISVQEGIPEAGRLQALQSIMLLMPDENREALHYLLLFLSEVADQSDINQMDRHNLSVCFAPSIFTLPSMVKTSPLVKSRTTSFRNRSASASKTPSAITSGNNKEVTESMDAHKCLELMVEQVDKLFMIPSDMIHVCQFSYLENADPVPHHELGQDRYGFGDFHSYINTCVNTTLKECRLKAKGWQYHDILRGIEVSSLTINDDILLRVWKGSVEIPTCTENVLRRLWSERHLWDADLIKCRVVSRIDENTEVFQYVTQAPPPLANRDICILRAWRQCRDNCFAVVSTSVSHPAATLMGSIRATVLAMRFLIEPIGPNASRLTVLNRVDIRGHSSDYYNRCYGAYSTLCVAHIRDSFKKPSEPDYLETEV